MNTGLLRYEESVLSRPAKGYIRETVKVKSTELTRAVSLPAPEWRTAAATGQLCKEPSISAIATLAASDAAESRVARRARRVGADDISSRPV
eukprot:19998-Heterococcus_DN1.PRE.2